MNTTMQKTNLYKNKYTFLSFTCMKPLNPAMTVCAGIRDILQKMEKTFWHKS